MELVSDGFQGIPQPKLPVLCRYKLDVGPDQVLVGGNQAQLLQLSWLYCLLCGRVVQQQMVGADPVGVTNKSQSAGGVGLWIAIDEQGPDLGGRKGGSQINGRCSFAHATFLISHRDNASHKSCRSQLLRN